VPHGLCLLSAGLRQKTRPDRVARLADKRVDPMLAMTLGALQRHAHDQHRLLRADRMSRDGDPAAVVFARRQNEIAHVHGAGPTSATSASPSRFRSPGLLPAMMGAVETTRA